MEYTVTELTNAESFSPIEKLDAKIKKLSTIVSQQYARIKALESKNAEFASKGISDTPSSKHVHNNFSSAKPPQIAPFSGKIEQQNSTKVKAFMFSIRKVGLIANMSEADMLALADCYLQDKAATWKMSLEARGEKPRSLEKLQQALIEEFVPADEKARANAKLMRLKLSGGVEKYIDTFRNLVEITGTSLSVSYLFFFNGLNDSFKEELTRKFPTGEPEDMSKVFEAVRTHELASQWSTARTSGQGKTKSPEPKRSKEKSLQQTCNERDHKAECWGPAGQGERKYYRKNSRCFYCGKKWTPNHNCDASSSSKTDPKE